MYKRKCRCGKSEKTFKMDIGPFYIADCCEEAGYDCYGNLKGDLTEEEVAEIEQEDSEEIEVSEEEMAQMEEMAGDMDQDGDVDADDVEAALDMAGMSKKELQALCDEKGIEFSNRDSKSKLLEKLK